MNKFVSISRLILSTIKTKFNLSDSDAKDITIYTNLDKPQEFGDLNCNAAMVLAKQKGVSPREIAKEIKAAITSESELSPHIDKVEIAGPGFINIHLTESTWAEIAETLAEEGMSPPELDETKKILIEFVSANPTGPLHLGHGRGGIVGDVLAKILRYLGHSADTEYYINDAGNQMQKLAYSLKTRCEQELGEEVDFPEDGYAGKYLVELAKRCIEESGLNPPVAGKNVIEKDDDFFEEYAKERLLENIKETCDSYGITFDRWFSEKTLHKSGAIEEAIALLKKKDLAYIKDDALWFKSTDFGDDKDRVIKKQDGTYTYIAADIAYHKDKFDRKYDVLIDVLGQDHHSYAFRLKATMEALGEKAENLHIILYQLVSISQGGEQVKMSKRAGTFEQLNEVIEKVGRDVARFFYLNRKVDAHLDFDLETALKKTEDNPVYYIQYAYVRTISLIKKGSSIGEPKQITLGLPEITLLKKICSLPELLKSISNSYATHQLSYYTLELAKSFHHYYATNKIIDESNLETSQSRLLMTKIVKQTLALCLDLLGLSKPEKM